MNSLLDKGAKSIRIRVFEFTSPAVDSGIHRNSGWDGSGAFSSPEPLGLICNRPSFPYHVTKKRRALGTRMGAEVRELTRTHVRRSLNLQIDREISLLVGYLLRQWFYRWWYVLGQRIKVFLGYKSDRSCLRLTCLHSLTRLFSDTTQLYHPPPSNEWQFASQRNQSTVITNAITDVKKRSNWIRSITTFTLNQMYYYCLMYFRILEKLV